MATISTPHYLLDQALRRLKPTPVTVPGMRIVEQHLRAKKWDEFVFAEPPAGSSLKPIMGDAGLPIIGHLIETFRAGPDYVLELYRKHGPLYFAQTPALPAVMAMGPDATQAVFSNRNKDFSQRAWDPVIGPFFEGGLMLLDFDEHMFHRRIMQEAFTRSRLTGYVSHIDSVSTKVLANDWVANDPRFLFHPAVKELTLDIASEVFMGHAAGTDRKLVTTINEAFTTTTRAGNAIVRKPVRPLTWWRGIQARKTLEDYFSSSITEKRRSEGTDMFSVLCHAQDEDGQTFTDDQIVAHMIFLMMAAHDTTTSTLTTMAYHLAANPQWQDKLRDESARIGDAPLDIDALEKLETYDLVINEALRLQTPLGFNFRRAVRDTELMGYYIPAGTDVVTWPGMNHRLSELWTDPERFDPARFAEPRSEHKSHRYAFAPFGGGAHKCIGMVFGQLEIKTVMHRLLRRYRLELPNPGYTPWYDFGGMAVPVDGMPITLRPIH
ncbi:cytochrome P450 [Mycobacterium sp. CBMA293]|uniref:cytochrome P450 n=1 Tax=unclassified Mycolicibacterium TaxID=2636767 RepID=UPI0012DC3F66|nr:MULTISPECIES: cytochrome P450 [unclassified Mycolicibacterium]MUL45402.1 cytochrome P450 [Mycolicibacterium sp. CBMA 360]MUL56922.1 cytochrome P450 [Mycolicibacterium sp. CBMA 335]MUL69962.1 cytochrome P450 [Mycolicibacterium sp. CBMA 311]MUL92010.1 cytochrome P450 [Mycolicibacterium sp. CBMA 230]MUM05748.1 cytochrome P450 [Mycolicibacterium sp. CBMA 213]